MVVAIDLMYKATQRLLYFSACEIFMLMIFLHGKDVQIYLYVMLNLCTGFNLL